MMSWQARLENDHRWRLNRIKEQKERACQQINALNGYLDKAARASGEHAGGSHEAAELGRPA
jgi:hypothetical protein